MEQSASQARGPTQSRAQGFGLGRPERQSGTYGDGPASHVQGLDFVVQVTWNDPTVLRVGRSRQTSVESAPSVRRERTGRGARLENKLEGPWDLGSQPQPERLC